MVSIKVAGSTFDFGLSLRELFRVWGEIASNPGEEIVIDLSECRFCNPCLLLGLFLLQKNLSQKGVSISIKMDCIHASFASYLELTSFQTSLNTSLFNQDQIEQLLGHYQDRSYLPLIAFPSTQINEDNQICDRLLEFLSINIRNKLSLDHQIFTAVSYLITEAVNNIKDHARTDLGYLFTQFYPNRGLMDICFADLGVSLLGSYQAVNRIEVNSHTVAMQSALNGDSTKDEKHRGFGISSSRRMLVQGLEGRFFMMSGNSFLDSRPDANDIIRVFPQTPDLQWNGTFLALRIPIQTKADFDYIKYVD